MKYKYVEVTYENHNPTHSELKRHHEIIENYASKGYRFVGYNPNKMQSLGKELKLELIFEKI